MEDRKVVLVTGAARGIGREIALIMAEKGYDISLNFRTKSDELDKLKEIIEEKGVRCFLVQGDVTHFEETEKN